MFGTASLPSTVSTFDVSGRGRPVGHAVRYDPTNGTVGYWRASEALVRLPMTAAWSPTYTPPSLTLPWNAWKLQLSATPGPSGASPKAGSRVSSVRNGAASGTMRPVAVAGSDP